MPSWPFAFVLGCRSGSAGVGANMVRAVWAVWVFGRGIRCEGDTSAPLSPVSPFMYALVAHVVAVGDATSPYFSCFSSVLWAWPKALVVSVSGAPVVNEAQCKRPGGAKSLLWRGRHSMAPRSMAGTRSLAVSS